MGDYGDFEDFVEAFYEDEDDGGDDGEFGGYGGGDDDIDEGMGGGRDPDDDIEGGGDAQFKGSYADRERTGMGGFADERAFGVFRTREEMFVGKLSAAFRNIANESIGSWENELSKIPNAYFMNPLVLATVMYAIDKENDPDFLDDFTASKKSAGYETKKAAYVVNRAADVARRNAGVVNVFDVYRYYKVVKTALKR